MENYEKAIEALIAKAAAANDSGDAMRFSQAAGNVANAAASMAFIAREGRGCAEGNNGSASDFASTGD